MKQTGKNDRALRFLLGGLAALGSVLIGVVPLAAQEIKVSGGVIVEKVANHPFAAVDAKLQAAIKGAKLVIVGEPNYQMMQRMVGRERKPAKAYFVFRPDLGTPIFDNDPTAAMEVPLKILLMERGDGKTVIRYKKPSSVLADYKGLESLGKQLDDLLAQLTDATIK